ncbi:uncharacterized protein LOC130732995 [Lotus japonicus]|uniref:uncharacterized protein LOC130732995 n=1 Tax=Lotus japonicus TaxID=34305 RepID=UPI002586FF27|nr:uncharacterized protein LOC130732995 [Lotus japonicus]
MKHHKRVSTQQLADRREYLHASHRRGCHDEDVSSSRKRDQKAAQRAGTLRGDPTPPVPPEPTPPVLPEPTPLVPPQPTPLVPLQPTPPIPHQPTPPVPSQPQLTIEPSLEPTPERSVELETSESSGESDVAAQVDPDQFEGAGEEEKGQKEPDLESSGESDVAAPFPGGPYNLSLLHHYPDHIAARTWHAILGNNLLYDDRRELRVATIGTKVAKKTFEDDDPDYQVVRLIVAGTRLYHLVCCWDEETNSFHMPFGEMTVTLDDVSALLHLPISERFYTAGAATRLDIAETCALLLGGRI